MARVTDLEATKTRLVQAAWTVIATEGIEAATLRRVATQAGCTTGLITHYFEDKNELVTVAYRRVLDMMIKDAAEAIASASGIAEQLRAAIEAIEPVRAGTREFTIVLMNFWAAAAVNPEFARHCRDDYRRWRRLIERVIRVGVAQGELRADTDVRALDDLLTLVSDGLSVGMTLTPAAYPARRRHALIGHILAPFLPPSRASAP